MNITAFLAGIIAGAILFRIIKWGVAKYED